MEQKKLLGQFAAKIAKSKMVYTNTKEYVDRLTRQAAKLERQYQELVQQRKSAQTFENNLKINYNDNSRYVQQVQKLSTMKDQKKRLKKQKDVADHDLLKNTLCLQQLVQQRQSLQAQAKQLSSRLQGITSQKQILNQEYEKTNEAIEMYSQKIRGLKTEIQNMKEVVAASTISQ